MKQVLDALGLVGFPKTSGSRRDPRARAGRAAVHATTQTREFAEIVARALARTHRGLVTTEWTKAKRRGVLIDANQNGEGKTIASVYSVRPKAGAPGVDAAALGRGERGPRPGDFTMDVVLRRVEQHGDLYADVLTTRQRSTRRSRALADAERSKSQESMTSAPAAFLGRRRPVEELGRGEDATVVARCRLDASARGRS